MERIVMLLLSVAALTDANSGALIKSKSGQPLTSSTLHWVSVSSGRMPEDAVEGGQGSYVCRFQHAGRLEIGSTDEEESNSCRIAYYEKVIISEKFEVLVNVQQAGRLVWTKWDRSLMSFVGAVQVDKHYVARVKTDDGYRLGHLDPTVQRGRIFTIDNASDVVLESNEGEILLEMEAIQYQVGPIASAKQRRKIQSQEDVQLAHTILDNMEDDGSSEQTTLVASTLSYVVNHSVYLSHVRGMIKGLPATVHLGDETSGGIVDFRWGDPSIAATFPQLMDVSHRLERGTAVNVSLTARRVTFDAPFHAQLTTTYSDQMVGRRQIEGQARQTILEEIRLEYGHVYFLNNGSVVPSTTSTSTTTTSTTTKPSTSTTTSSVSITTETSAVTAAPSSKQTKETLELKSRSSGGQRLTPTSAILVLFLLVINR